MPLFKLLNQDKIALVKSSNFELEKDLQRIVEKNLEIVFNCQFVATEFPTGKNHSGRIDTLALSEDKNPVIIEYKKIESSDLINQSLFYLSWLKDHRGDFEIAVNSKLGHRSEIDWNDIRVICLAPGFKKYDLHAVKMMNAGIELWKYRLFEDNSFYLEEIFGRNKLSQNGYGKNSVMGIGKKTNQIITTMYSLEDHLSKIVEESLKKVFHDIRDFALSLDDSIEEAPKKTYIAYKLNKNFLCIEVQKKETFCYI